MLHAIGTGLLILGAVLAVEWVVAYHHKTGGRWRSGPMGRHLMAFMASIASMLVLGAAHEVVVDILDHKEPLWFLILRTIALASIPAMVLWRRIILYRVHREPQESQQ